ncbi:MAG: hypothetical protein Q4C98_01770 [Capnocytophaga sp.]|nr:hypothetical protein [Capnocytophaga sp.]
MRVLLLLSIASMLWACSKSSSEDEQPLADDQLSFTIETSEGVNVSNLRVGNQIPIELKEITDSQAEEGLIYMFKPIGNDATRHQVLGTDYAFKLKEETSFRDVSYVEIVTKNDLPKFVIVPKVPGTFLLEFQLQRYDPNTKKFVGNPVNKQLVFNVVKINFHFPTQETRSSGTFRHSIHRRDFKFSIDDGNREYDTYLSNYASSKRYEYITHYDGQTKSGEFSVGGQYEFRDNIETKKGPIPMNEVPQTVTIEITQYLQNGLKNIIKYDNVQLEY